MSGAPDLRAFVAEYAEPDEVEAVEASVLARLAWRLRRGAKECAKCHEDKPVTAYGRDASRRDGLRPYCLECRRV